ncbi:TlpA family protein disulfide reductase [Lacihabitans lacunae]|uniref:TlpA family protein disulfide reductase n=1 Tax=Lacihabitans lacunae TaxID=1028214 RepID=A0ABV7Z283_9BACT
MNINSRHSFKIAKLRAISFFIYLLISSVSAYAQDSIRISGQLHNNTQFAKVVVQKFGIGVFDIVAVPIDKETGKFFITAPADVEPGIYRFKYSQTGYGDFIDVIINGKDMDIAFSIDVSKEPDKRFPHFTASKENAAWHQFDQSQKAALGAIRVQEDFLFNYPNKTGKTYQTIVAEYEKAKKVYQKQHELFVNKTPYYWAKAKAQYSKVYFTNLTDHPRIQQFALHENFWEDKPTTNVQLLNSPIYIDAILDYLQYYMNPNMEFGEEEQNSGFKKCVDTIMLLYGKEETTKEFALKYLQIGFKEIGKETVLQYLDEKYAANAQCTEDDDELKKRLAGYEALKIGNQAPNITFTDREGKEKTLLDFKQDRIIVVFWASWCPHCMLEVPKLNEWAKNNPNTKVIAISLDEDKTAYETAIANFTNLSHYCDFKKWNSKAVADYYVYGTPTFVVLNKDKKIVGKFSGFASIEKL